MNRKPLDSIDHLIKQAADQYQPAYDEAAWLLMQQKLDQQAPKKRRPFFFWFAIILISTIAIAYYAFHAGMAASDNTLAQSAKTINRNPSNNIIDSRTNTTRSTTQPASVIDAANQPEATIPTPTNPDNAEKESVEDATPAAIAGNKMAAAHLQQKANFSNTRSALKSKKDRIAKNTKGKVKVNIAPAFSDDTQEIESAQAPEKSNSAESIEKSTAIATIAGGATTDSSLQQPLTTATVQPKEKTKPASKNNTSQPITAPKQVYIGLLLGTEGAATKFSGLQSPLTTRWGIQLGYRLTKHFSIQTGYYYNAKKYTGSGKDYHFASGSYLGAVNVTKVDAICKMIEIPLNIRYQAKLGKQVQWYAQTGLSSYFLNREDYSYYYYRYNNPQVKTANYSGNKQMLSQVNLGIGIERNINDKVSFIVEAYSNLPLKGMGAGQVKIYNAGFMSGIRYYPFARQHK